MTLPSTKVMFLSAMSNCFRCYGNFKFPYTNEKLAASKAYSIPPKCADEIL